MHVSSFRLKCIYRFQRATDGYYSGIFRVARRITKQFSVITWLLLTATWWGTGETVTKCEWIQAGIDCIVFNFLACWLKVREKKSLQKSIFLCTHDLSWSMSGVNFILVRSGSVLRYCKVNQILSRFLKRLVSNDTYEGWSKIRGTKFIAGKLKHFQVTSSYLLQSTILQLQPSFQFSAHV
jgi:hypothetical protein